MNNTFGYSRNQECLFLNRLSPCMAGACLTVMRELLFNAAYISGKYGGTWLERGEIAISHSAIRLKTGLSIKTIRNVLQVLKKLNETGIVRAGLGAGLPTVYVIVKYELWDGLSKKGHSDLNEGGIEGAQYGPEGHSVFIGENEKRGTVLKEVKEVKEGKGGAKAFKELLKNNNSPNESPTKAKASGPLPDSSESKKSTLESDLQKLHTSPHWPYLEKLTAWFYHPDQSCTPNWTDLSLSDQIAALKTAEKILRIDMKDAPGSEERLEEIVQWATQDSFWSVNTQAIPPLRKKKDGVPKWMDLEKRRKGAPKKNDPDDFLRLLEEREKEDEPL